VRGEGGADLVGRALSAAGDDNPDGCGRRVRGSEGPLRLSRQLRHDILRGRLRYQPGQQELLDWTFALAIMASPKATLDSVDTFGKTDFRPDLASFTVPTLIIHGTADKTVPIDPSGRVAAAAIPSVTFIEYDDEPHGLFAMVPNG